MNVSNPMTDCRIYEHEAMNTTFSLRLLAEDEFLARSLAQLCMDRIDVLEGQLSRFQEASDVARINALRSGETLYLSESCHQCLLQGMSAAAQTHGLFDITLGARIQHRKSEQQGPLPDLRGRLKVHPDVPAVTCEEEGRQIDLGGIGKGYALDQLVALLNEWEINGALLGAGASSLLAHGSFAWPVDLCGNGGSRRVILDGCSLSASGTGIQGSHLVHPWGEEAMPSQPCERVWVMAESAALAEVWSTALMLVDLEEIPEVLEGASGASGVKQVFADRGGEIIQVV